MAKKQGGQQVIGAVGGVSPPVDTYIAGDQAGAAKSNTGVPGRSPATSGASASTPTRRSSARTS
jgi:hypothetical protein